MLALTDLSTVFRLLPFLISSHTYGRVCRIIFIGHCTVLAGPTRAFVIPLLLLYTIESFFCNLRRLQLFSYPAQSYLFGRVLT